MNLYKKIFKLNLFNQIYAPIMLFFSFVVFINIEVPSLTSNELANAKLFTAMIVFLPVFIFLIINICFIFKLKTEVIMVKIWLLVISLTVLLPTILMFILNKYFVSNIENNVDSSTYKSALKRNVILSSSYLIVLVVFAIIYSIIDSLTPVTIKDITPSEVLAILFIISIFFFMFDYLVMLFFVVNYSEIENKQKLLLAIPLFNIYYLNKLNKCI